MKYTTLPNTNIKVSKICLGTMTFGRQNNEAQAHQQMRYALDKGVNFLILQKCMRFPTPQKHRVLQSSIWAHGFQKTPIEKKLS